MADRPIVYAGSIPQDTDVLRLARLGVEGLAALSGAVFGAAAALVDGLTVGPNSPAALNVIVQPGTIYAPLALDASAYGSLAADTRTVLHQGIIRTPTTLTITPPGTPGQSRVYLVQVACQVVDGDASVLPYYNAADPDVALSGPGNSGTPQNTTRAVKAIIALKAGTPAATGSEVTPTPDAGYVALAAVTVPNGATSVTSGNIVDSLPRRVPTRLPDMGTGSLGTNGYMRLPGGLILQWGNVNTNGSGQAAITFPLTFPNAFYRAIINPLGGYVPGVLNSSSTSGFNQTIADSSTLATAPAGVVVGYYAIGS